MSCCRFWYRYIKFAAIDCLTLGVSFQAAIQAVFYDVSVSSKFDLCIVIVIFLNMIAMAVDHYKMTDYVSNILDILNILFTTIFTLECVIKIIGLRHHYFRQPWNVFDFVVVVLSLLGMFSPPLNIDLLYQV